jgi:hypothetical protein
MKLMTVGEMISLAVPSEETLTVAQDRLRPLTAETAGTLDGLAEGLKASPPRYKTREVQLDGKPYYVFFFSVTGQNLLEVNYSVFVGEKRQNDKWLWCLGAEMIARELNCRGITFVSKRRGHIEQGLNGGYEMDGVKMSKLI